MAAVIGRQVRDSDFEDFENNMLNTDAIPNLKYLIGLLVLIPCLCFAEIYKWTDENGRVHYGDSPKESDRAEKVEVEINSYEHVTYEEIEYYQGAEAKSKTVTMYATSWCGYCKKARDYFRRKKINYVEYDIEKDQRAKRRYDELGGRGVPVILVGKQRMNGFSAAGFERFYQ